MLFTFCPFCGEFANCQSHVGQTLAVPENGDISVCVHCGEAAIFDFTLPANVRQPTEEEQNEINKSADMKLARAEIEFRQIVGEFDNG